MANFLAIDADARGLVVAAGTVLNGVARVEKAAARPDAPPLTPATAADLGAKLKDLLAAAGIRPAPVLLCVGRDRLILKDVKHPPTPPAEEPAVVRFQAVRDLAESPDELVMDYAPLAPTADGEKRAGVVFVRKDVVAAAKAMLDAAGLKLAGITPRPYLAPALLKQAGQIAAESSDVPAALLSLWPGGGEFTVVRGNTVLFTRALSAAALADVRPLAGELKRNLAVYAAQHPDAPVAAVFLPESATPGAGWSGRLEELLPVPVVPFDPLAGTEADAGPDALRGRFAATVGALSAKAADALPINFAAPRQPKAPADPNRSKVLLGALLGVVLLGGGGVLGFLEIDKAGRRAALATRERDDVDRELQKHELDAKRLAAADEFRDREVVWLDELYDLSDRFPDVKKMRVTELDAAPAPPPKAAARGMATAPSTAAAKAGPGKPAKPAPVGVLRLVVTTDEPALVDRLVDGMNRDGFYSGTSKTTTGLAASGSKAQQFTVTTGVIHRDPDDYKRKLAVPPPPAASRVPPPAAPPAAPAPTRPAVPADGFDEFGFDDIGGRP